MSGHILKAWWPIIDSGVPAEQIASEALTDLPTIAIRAHARITGRPSWDVLPSCAVPGSGGVTAHVLVITVPAVPVSPRPYRTRTRR